MSLDWAIRAQKDGHKVLIYSTDEARKNVGKGLINRAPDLYEYLRWPDLVFYPDNCKYLDAIQSFIDRGVPVVGTNKAGAEWESDRSVGEKVMKKVGIDVPATKLFTDYDAAIAYVKKTMQRYVSKPNGEVGASDKSLSYCSKTPEDMVYMLEKWKKNDKLKGAPFILQEFKPGIEFAVGGWFGPGGFNQGWEENWEHKKLMNDELGVATGEQGTVMRMVKRSKLADQMLKPLEEELERISYVGNIDVNCIIDEEGKPWPLEFTMRPGWPAFNIAQALHKGDHAEWMIKLWEGKDAKNWELDKIATGVVLSIPDYPYSKITHKEVEGIPIYNVSLDNPNIHPCEVQMGTAPMNQNGKIVEAPCLTTAGDYVLNITGVGETVMETQKIVYKELSKISLPNSPMYRTDIGKKLQKQLPELQRHGYALAMQF